MSNSYNVLGDFLQRNAYENVWCTPNQDKQAIIQPARLTPAGGAWKSVDVMWRTHPLPDSVSRFHVYQIGQIIPLLVGLKTIKNRWVSVAEICQTEDLIVDLYTLTGVQLHRTQAWYRVTPENNLIVAVRLPDPLKVPVDLNTEALFMRFYTNAYFQSVRSDLQEETVHVDGILVTSQQDILSFQQRLAVYTSKTYGYTYCFLNGFRVATIDLLNTVIGDLVEFVYDSSIKRIVTFNVADLQDFTSTLDSVHKYLLHYAQSSDTIDYHDDIDLFLVKPLPAGRYSGVYFHKNNEQAIRMVTHKDYAVPVSYLMSYSENRPELGNDVDALQLILQIRKSGWERPLIFEHNRILDLYRMSDADVLGAMIGIDATVSVWDCAALEDSGYTGLMRANLGDISQESVQLAYGYNAVSKLIGDTPSHVIAMGGMGFVDVPVGLQAFATAYEYDVDGYLLEWHSANGTVYAAQNPNTKLVEMIFGVGSESFQDWWGLLSNPVDLGFNYRFYHCGKFNGVIDNHWVDDTGSGRYAITNGVVQWMLDPNTQYPMVRGNKNHIVYQLDYLAVDSLISFSLREYRTDLQAYQVMTVPPGKIEIFLNGKSLIEKLDYYVNFPRVTITNKEYLIDPQNQSQTIVIRMMGFCDSALNYEQVTDVGFVEYGVLSKNNRFDIRDDKVNRILVNGSLYRYDELHYAEENYDVAVLDARNGAPYSITDIVVPMNTYLYNTDAVVDPTYTLRLRSQLVDKEVSDYLSLKIPEKEPVPPSAIPTLYQVVSPFFSKIIYDLLSGALWFDEFQGLYSDNYVVQTVQPYVYLLDFDPIKDGLTPDPHFVVIHPHNLNNYVDMGIYQFQFLSRVVALFGSGKVELSSHVRLALFGGE